MVDEELGQEEQEQEQQELNQEEEGGGEAQVDDETIARATLYGWSPKEDFRGDPDRWISADEYVKRADTLLPISKAMNRVLEGKVTDLQGTVQELNETISRMAKVNKGVAKKAYDQALGDIRDQQALAITNEDGDEFKRLEEVKDNLEKPEEIEVKAAPKGKIDPVTQQWIDDREWYRNDHQMRNYALGIGNFVAQQYGNLSTEDFLTKVDEEVKLRFPEKFSNPNRGKPNAVDGGSLGGGSQNKGGKGKTFNDLPKDAKDACKDLVAQGALTKEQYVKDYFEEE